MSEAIEKVLRKTPLFAALSDDEMTALRRRVSGKTYARGEFLFNEGDPCRGLHIVGRGKVRVFKLSASGREQILSIEGPGNSFAQLPGEIIPPQRRFPRSQKYYSSPAEIFRNFVANVPEVGLKVIAVVGSGLRRLIGIIEDLSFTTVRQRLIGLIVRLAQASAARTSDGVHVELNKTQQDLAAELGTVRELVSRNLGCLQAEGYLDVNGRDIIVKDLPGLRREQESPQ